MGPVEWQLVPCERCGRQVVDARHDFGEFALWATCGGIEVRVDGEVRCLVTADELRHFLHTAYGPEVPADDAALRRAYLALDAFDGREWAGADRSRVVSAVVEALRGTR